MLKTNKDFVSEVRNHLNSINKDDYIPARVILSAGYSYVQYLINNRGLAKVFRDLASFTFVPCVEMKRIKSVDCPIGKFRTCDKIMRSKKQIPDIFNGKLGYIIEGITNIDNSEEYFQLRTPADYNTTKKRKFGNVKKYFYISNKYLYILNTTSEIVNINALFLDEEEAKCLSDCEDCDECKSKLDNKFVCPEEFRSSVTERTVQILLGGNKSVVPDENPDLDQNQKTRTQ